MPSPFPGMDPFLENPAFWTDFHFTFINYWREALADTLPDEFEAIKEAADLLALVMRDHFTRPGRTWATHRPHAREVGSGSF